ncbi:MAG TPA: hypothetical protein VNZ03_35600 [Terriglobales bacterium]|jgi:hypothetical protein|nr:hypothetical protein [Terriglobales bacterium]
MKLVNGILAGLLMSGAALAQQSTGATSPPQNNPSASQSGTSGIPQTTESPRFAPGTVIPVELTKSIDAKKAKSGDNVEARVTQDLKAGNGQLIVMGHVTEAQPRNKEQKESQVGIVFDHAVMKNGSDVAMPMSIQAIIGPTALNPVPNNAGGAAGQSTPPSPAGGMPTGNAGGRSTGMGSSGSPSTVSPSSAGGEAPAEAQPGTGSNQPITASTQGVVGISNLRLSPTEDGKTGSVVSSEKSNVKLDSGTLMLLRVDQ